MIQGGGGMGEEHLYCMCLHRASEGAEAGDPGETAASTATSEHLSSMAGVRESPSGSTATTF